MVEELKVSEQMDEVESVEKVVTPEVEEASVSSDDVAIENEKTEKIEAIDIDQYIMSTDGKETIGVMNQMNDLLKKEVEGMKVAIQKIIGEANDMASSMGEASKEIGSVLLTIDKLKDLVTVKEEKHIFNIKQVLKVIDENEDIKTQLGEEFIQKIFAFEQLNLKLAHTTKVLKMKEELLFNVEAGVITSRNAKAIVDMIPMIVAEIKEFPTVYPVNTFKKDNYLNKIVLKTEEELADMDIKSVKETLEMHIRDKVDTIVRPIEHRMPSGDSTYKGKSIAHTANAIAKNIFSGITYAGVENDIHIVATAFLVAFNMLLTSRTYKFEMEGSLRLTPHAGYQAKLSQFVDILSIESLHQYRLQLLTNLSEAIHKEADNVAIFKAATKVIDKKMAYLKEHDIEKYNAIIKSGEEMVADIERVAKEEESLITDVKYNEMKREIEKSLKDFIDENKGVYASKGAEIKGDLKTPSEKEDAHE